MASKGRLRLLLGCAKTPPCFAMRAREFRRADKRLPLIKEHSHEEEASPTDKHGRCRSPRLSLRGREGALPKQLTARKIGAYLPCLGAAPGVALRRSSAESLPIAAELPGKKKLTVIPFRLVRRVFADQPHPREMHTDNSRKVHASMRSQSLRHVRAMDRENVIEGVLDKWRDPILRVRFRLHAHFQRVSVVARHHVVLLNAENACDVENKNVSQVGQETVERPASMGKVNLAVVQQHIFVEVVVRMVIATIPQSFVAVIGEENLGDRRRLLRRTNVPRHDSVFREPFLSLQPIVDLFDSEVIDGEMLVKKENRVEIDSGGIVVFAEQRVGVVDLTRAKNQRNR